MQTGMHHAALARRPCWVEKGINEGAPVTGGDGGRDGRAALRNWRIAIGSFSIWHWLIVGIVVMLLFGKGRFSDMMGDVAKGIKSFKKGMAEDEEQPKQPQRLQEQPPMEAADPKSQLQEMQNDRPASRRTEERRGGK